jgi:hypothetical protein
MSLLVLCGVIGVVLGAGAYLALNANRLSLRGYAWATLLSCALAAAALFAQWSLPAALTEGFYAGASIYHLVTTERSNPE